METTAKPNTRLSDRESLSGEPQVSAPIIRIASAPRTCSACGAEDCEEKVETTHGVVTDHFVTVELRWLKAANEDAARAQITPYLKAKGWSYKLFQGKHAKQRFVCRPCLRSLTIMERDWANKGKQEQTGSMAEFYEVLCN